MSSLRHILIVTSVLFMTACGVIPGTKAPLEDWATFDQRLEESKKAVAKSEAEYQASLKAESKPEPAKPVGLNNEDYYEAHVDGRIYVFDDQKTYLSFVSTGEAPYRLARIGDGPEGQTLVFGLSEADKKKRSGIAGMDMYFGQLKGSDTGFYGEMIVEERFYVFSNWDDLVHFKKTLDAPLRFTEIGAGPGGRTIVFVLNNDNKKKRPDALRAKFRAVHGG